MSEIQLEICTYALLKHLTILILPKLADEKMAH